LVVIESRFVPLECEKTTSTNVIRH